MGYSICSIDNLKNGMRNSSALSQVAPRLALTCTGEWLDHDKSQRDVVNTVTDTSRQEASAIC